MNFPNQFIAATIEYTTLEQHVPAPYFRKLFEIPNNQQIKAAALTITGLGFYRVFVNGIEVTKGALAPYISNPDHIVYYDCYDVSTYLSSGKNVLGILLGNGFNNNPGGHIWDFDKAPWRSAPKTALRLEITMDDHSVMIIESDESFRTSPSPIIFDDYRCGEYYDARLEQPGWNTAEFDDSNWGFAFRVPSPRGVPRLCSAEPITVHSEIKPVSITPQDDGFLYDFGVNFSGVCRLCIEGYPGQKVIMYHGEYAKNGKLVLDNIRFNQMSDMQKDMVQKSIYICKGQGKEEYTPSFVYNGFRYVLVKGISKKQATPELLTYLVMHSKLTERGGFSCSDDTANKLQAMVRRSDLSNFYYFPTDCPHREKNGWTGDAALSCEHMLLNLAPENSFREWIRNICKAQNEQGALPGIIPTAGWGFAWGNGPAWDCALVYLPYFVYRYRGDKTILQEASTSIFRYLHYLTTRMDSRGLLEIGLGDWCSIGGTPKSPLIFTDSVISMDICRKASSIFEVLGMTAQQEFAMKLYQKLRTSIRKYLIDFSTMTAIGNCQTSQAMAIYYDVFDEAEKQQAFQVLLKCIEEADNHMDVGILGGRVLFHVLSAFGKSDLAYSMIVRPDFPSYGYWVSQGSTTLWESFHLPDENVDSFNHHFWGDISGWFIQWILGIQLNPYFNDLKEIKICPQFITNLSYAEGYHEGPDGKISISWTRENEEKIILKVSIPKAMHGQIILPNDWKFPNGTSQQPACSGEFTVIRRNKQSFY